MSPLCPGTPLCPMFPYMLIMRALHFCKNLEADEETPSRIYKVEKVLDYFNKRMHDVYQPCTN